MRLIQFVVRLGIPLALFMAVGVEPTDLGKHPQPVAAFGFFWALEVFYTPYVLNAPWFNQHTYRNVMRILFPTMTWAGMLWGLGGLAMSANGHPFPSGSTFLGLSLLGALSVMALPLSLQNNPRRASGPRPLHKAGGDLGDAVALAVEKAEARSALALGHEELEQVADAVGVPAAVLEEAVTQVQSGEVMQSQPTPQTSLRKPPKG